MGRKRLFVVLGGLYLAQAIPSYLFAAALPPIMREAGVSRSEIGYLSLWFLPLLLKFFWAPVVDRIRPFARAHRAGWVIVTQTGVIISLLCLIPLGATNVWGIITVGPVRLIADLDAGHCHRRLRREISGAGGSRHRQCDPGRVGRIWRRDRRHARVSCSMRRSAGSACC
jgi:hypothetical protein